MEYSGPLSIGTALECSIDVGIFIETMVDEVEKLAMNKEEDFIPPIVYSAQGRVFNVNYNFMIECLAKTQNESRIKDDFLMDERMSEVSVINALFLVVAILENYYGVVRANSQKIDLAKYKSNKTIEIKPRFYNVVLYKNGENIRRFSATPFSESVVKKFISPEKFELLEAITKIEKIEQVAFGQGRYNDYVAVNKIVPEYVAY